MYILQNQNKYPYGSICKARNCESVWPDPQRGEKEQPDCILGGLPGPQAYNVCLVRPQIFLCQLLTVDKTSTKKKKKKKKYSAAIGSFFELEI